MFFRLIKFCTCSTMAIKRTQYYKRRLSETKQTIEQPRTK
jgi:hypothetical protein